MDFLYLLIPTFFIILFLTPLFVEVKLTLDVLTFSGVLSVFLFKIKLHHLIYRVENHRLIMQEEKDDDEKEFEFDSRQVVFYKSLLSEVKDKTRLKELFVFYNLGLNDAFASAMAAGTVNTALLIFFTAIKNQKPTASLGVYDTVSYNREIAEFAVKTKISVTLFDILYALFIAYITSVRFVHKENEKKSKQNAEEKNINKNFAKYKN